MKKAKKIPGIPEQTRGAFHDTEDRKDFMVPELAVQKFEILKERFFSINYWKDYCGGLSAEFKLYDQSGSFVDRKPKTGDYVRINIPAPDNTDANYDWVKIVNMDDQTYNDDELERYLITCRPSKAPGSRNNHIAHFYSAESTSNFVITLGQDYIKIGVYGRNEIPNTSRTGFWGKIRNFLISLFGGYTRLAKIQWKSLTEGLLDF
ncbi:hypothetical protein [Epilithonimonas arachidiradicis]|uniref:Uncharacterized protein n=1 Tax=Epilithonimonas arachidiradicis TaxID=1617282 RepID=A0A420D8K5_9FLAO|nr:hypothetical protein [Epilithonimonas arachidiradicis]RKE87187.1 hypothetical protein BXY58_2063 [Epilithonimonas arachidiradicis]GGG58998.1 hypothetical protein GCM10007332_20810 [Epilithonimonas arachidiradicis]